MTDCLIVSCSARKRGQQAPAIELYDGNFFRILRKHQPKIDIFILSAKYGLIPADGVIETYDQRLTVTGDMAFLQKINRQAASLGLRQYETIYTCMGAVYLGYLRRVVTGKLVNLAEGAKGIGQMQAALKTFCQNLKGV